MEGAGHVLDGDAPVGIHVHLGNDRHEDGSGFERRNVARAA